MSDDETYSDQEEGDFTVQGRSGLDEIQDNDDVDDDDDDDDVEDKRKVRIHSTIIKKKKNKRPRK